MTNARFVIGRKLEKSFGSSVAFLMTGRRRLSLKAVGKIPSRIDEFTMAVIIGSSSSRQAFRIRVGMGSRGHDLEGEARMVLRTVSMDTSLNSASEQRQVELAAGDHLGVGVPFRRWCSFDIFSTK